MTDGAIDADGLVNERPNPFRIAPVEEAHLAVGMPATVENPAPQVLGKARNGVAIELRPAFFNVPDLSLKRFAQTLVGVERQYPVVSSQSGCDILLRGIALPGRFHDPRA